MLKARCCFNARDRRPSSASSPSPSWAGTGSARLPRAAGRRNGSAGLPSSPFPYNLGRLLQAGGKNREAAVHFEFALASRPNLVEGWFHLGEIHAAEERMADAVACWRRALEIDPAYAAASLALAKALPAAD
ncbi:MAG TPA: tetratricopeptide repeat protein [Thermoanaerobaculia bacterium]|nr:tetratricopeptide repeat protein [Thermoanaerobaculia bacterium]